MQLATATAAASAATVPARPPRTTFRGTRILTGLIVGFAGAVHISFGALAIPIAADLGRQAVDPGLMGTLLMLAPFIVILGVVHVISAVGVAQDRRWGLPLATWAVALGVFVTLAAIVFALAGRDAFALADPDPAPAHDGLGILLWTLLWYGVAGWGIQRVVAARSR